MAAIAFGLLFGGYAVMFWGYCMVRGYPVSLTEVVWPGRWPGGWPPKTAAAVTV